jgi:large subunit ribosomal protein L29
MNTQELRELSATELVARSRELRDELFHLRIQKAGGQLEKPSQVRNLRKEVARIETILTERQIAAAKEKATAASATN